MSVTQAGVIRSHGPINSRCSNSNKPPVTNYPTPLVTTHSTPLGDPIQAPSTSSLSIHPLSVKILKRIPRGSRHCVATKLAVILNEICASGEVEAWDRLFRFPPRCLQAPRTGGHRQSLASQVNKLVELEADPVVASIRPLSKPSSQNLDTLATRVTTKLEEGDFKGAVRLACSEDSFADLSNDTIAALKSKHPAPHPDTKIPMPPDASNVPVPIAEEEVARAVHSFPNGSAGGPDGLRPQHLKDLISVSAERGGRELLGALTNFTNLVLRGGLPNQFGPLSSGRHLLLYKRKVVVFDQLLLVLLSVV